MTRDQTTSNASLAARTEFMRLDAKSCERILRLKPIVDRQLPIALDAFYQRVRETPQVRRFFSSDSHMTAAKGAQLGHWAAISAGKFDERYESGVRAIGLAHARIGLEPHWYIGGYALILDVLVKSILSELWPRGFLGRGAKDAVDEAGAALGALVKAVFLDMDLAISVYVEAAEEARVKGEAEALAKERALVAGSIGAGLSKLADKDLAYRMNEDMPEAYKKLQSDFNGAITQLADAFRSVDVATDTVHSGALEITAASNDLSRRTEQQASSLEETAAALDEITSTVHKTAEGAKQAREVVSAAREDAKRGGEIVGKAVEAMGKIEKSSQQISQIIGVIDEIAFQTNLLALNAGVEAARAGDAGRGFAVVASEVRALAQRSAEAAKEIKGLISTSTAQVAEGVELVAQTGQALERIEAKVSEINNVVTDIASSAQEQATGLQQVNAAVNEMDKATQQNAAMSEQATAASLSLSQESERLSQLVGQFRVGRGADDPIRRELKKLAPHAFPEPTNAPSADRSPGARRPLAKTAVNASGSGRRAALAENASEDWKEF